MRMRFELSRHELRGRMGTSFDPRLAVRVETEVVEEIPSPLRVQIDPSLGPGQRVIEPGLAGRQVRAFRVIERGAGRVLREPLGIDTYHPTPTLVRVG